MSKLIYASSLNAFKAAYPDYSEPSSLIHKSVGFTGDGYIYTHGKLMKANVTSDPSNPYGLDFTLNSQTLTVTVAEMVKSVTLPVIGVQGEDNLISTISNGNVTIKHALSNPDWTSNQIIGPLNDTNESVKIPNITFDKYGHFKSYADKTITLNHVKQNLNNDGNVKYLLFGNSINSITAETQFSTSIKAVASTGSLYATILYEDNNRLSDKYAIKNHASSNSEYGLGSTSNYGHVKLSDSTSSDSDVNSGVAATPKSVSSVLNTAKLYAEGLFASNDALIFAGTINASSGVIVTINSALANKYNITPNVTKLIELTNYSAGWTFKITTNGSIGGIGVLEVGDMIVATNDCINSYKEGDWTPIQTNIDGAVSVVNNLTENQLVIGSTNKTIKSLSAGTNGQFLKMINGIPKWSDFIVDTILREIKVDGSVFLDSSNNIPLDIVGGNSINLSKDPTTGKLTINSNAITSDSIYSLNVQNNGSLVGAYNPVNALMNLSFSGGLSASFLTDSIIVEHTNKINSLTTAKLGKIAYDVNGHITSFTEVTSLKNPNTLTFGTGSATDTYDGSTAKTLKFAAGTGVDCSLLMGYANGTITITPSISHKYRPVSFKANSSVQTSTEILSNSSNGQLILSGGNNVSIERIGSTGELKINSSYVNTWRNITAFKLSTATSGQVLTTSVGTADLDFGDEFIWDDRESANGGRLHLGWAEVDESGKITYTI